MSRCALAVCGDLLAWPAAAETIYISNEQDSSVSVIDGDTLAVIETIPVGRRPRGIGLSAAGTRLYVAAGDDNRIDVVDVASRKVTGSLPSGIDPEAFDLHPDGRRLYVANENDNLVSVIDTVERRIIAEIPVGVEPEGMAVSPDGTIDVNTSETTSMVHFIDAATQEVFDSVLVDTRPRVARFTADGKRLWVSSEIRGRVSVIGVASRNILAMIEFAVPGLAPELLQPVGVQLTRDGKRAFVALGPTNRVAEVDQQTFEVCRYYLVGQRVWHLALSLDESRLYTTNGNSSDVSVIDLRDNKVIKSISTGRAPWGVVVAP
jgi:PQQ-dependent catabolism-associated beta-propeller protein